MKLLQLPNPGNGGRLGNQLFTIASTIGLALRHGYTPRFHADWKYRDHFNIPDEWFGPIYNNCYLICETKFEHDSNLDYLINLHSKSGYGVLITKSYLQSPKYWEGYEDEIRKYLTPKDCDPYSIDATAIHYRRGDYVGNPNYAQLPMSYYMNHVKGEVMAFSDEDLFAGFHHLLSTGDTEIEDFKLMASCKRHVISNSTFAWWAAYLSGGEVIYPPIWFDGELAKRCSTKDLFPKGWIEGSTAKTDLRDVTFVIPVSYDHPDRYVNLVHINQYLRTHFDTNIIIGEINTHHMSADVYFDYNGKFHRTKAINEMTRMAKTPYVVNYDADVIIPPFQILEMAQTLRNGADIVYPYDGTFYWMGKEDRQHCHGDLSGLVGKRFRSVGATAIDRSSYGGAVGYNMKSFFDAGGENEHMVSYGAEDQERWHRFNTLGLDVKRVPGPLYHIDHYRGKNSTFNHENGRRNMQLWDMESKMSKEELTNFVKTWEWMK
jgi:hypothetical protein